MPRYPHSAVTAKQGINFVRTIIEGAGCLFHKIEQENDLGIDAIVELLQDGAPIHRQCAIQIKSGNSYYNSSTNECQIPIGSHRDYWMNYNLPVYGIVHLPSPPRAFWTDIKEHLKAHPKSEIIRFKASEINEFGDSSFSTLFVPDVNREIPILSLEDSLRLIRSPDNDEFHLALSVLFRRYPNAKRTWEELIFAFTSRPIEKLPPRLIYYLAHIPGHGDILYWGESPTTETRKYASSLLNKWGYPEAVKLLQMIDEENAISRGSVGQSVHALLSSMPQAADHLSKAAKSEDLGIFTRECAAAILAIDNSPNAEPVLRELADGGSRFAAEILAHLREYGFVNPY